MDGQGHALTHSMLPSGKVRCTGRINLQLLYVCMYVSSTCMDAQCHEEAKLCTVTTPLQAQLKTFAWSHI
jgi:hypothetical protein